MPRSGKSTRAGPSAYSPSVATARKLIAEAEASPRMTCEGTVATRQVGPAAREEMKNRSVRTAISSPQIKHLVLLQQTSARMKLYLIQEG